MAHVDPDTNVNLIDQIHDQNLKNSIGSQQNRVGQGYYSGAQLGIVDTLAAGVPEFMTMDASDFERVLNPFPSSLNIWDKTGSRFIFLPAGYYTVDISFKIDTTANNSTCLVDLVDAGIGVISSDLVELPRAGTPESHTVAFQFVAQGNVVNLQFTGSVAMDIIDVAISAALIMAPSSVFDV